MIPGWSLTPLTTQSLNNNNNNNDNGVCGVFAGGCGVERLFPVRGFGGDLDAGRSRWRWAERICGRPPRLLVSERSGEHVVAAPRPAVRKHRRPWPYTEAARCGSGLVCRSPVCSQRGDGYGLWIMDSSSSVRNCPQRVAVALNDGVSLALVSVVNKQHLFT